MSQATYAIKSLGYATIPGTSTGSLLKVGNDSGFLPPGHFIAALIRINRDNIDFGSGKPAIELFHTNDYFGFDAVPEATSGRALTVTSGNTSATLTWTGVGAGTSLTNSDFLYLDFQYSGNNTTCGNLTAGWYPVSAKNTNDVTLTVNAPTPNFSATSVPVFVRQGGIYTVGGGVGSGTLEFTVCKYASQPYATGNDLYLEFTLTSGSSAPPNGVYRVTSVSSDKVRVFVGASYDGTTGKALIKRGGLRVGIIGNSSSTYYRRAFVQRRGTNTNGNFTHGSTAYTDWSGESYQVNWNNTTQGLSNPFIPLPYGETSGTGYAPSNEWCWVFIQGMTGQDQKFVAESSINYDGASHFGNSVSIGHMQLNNQFLCFPSPTLRNMRGEITTYVSNFSPNGTVAGSGLVLPTTLESFSFIIGNRAISFDIAKLIKISTCPSKLQQVLLMQGVSPRTLGLIRHSTDFEKNFGSLSEANSTYTSVPVSELSYGGTGITWNSTGGPTMQVRIDDTANSTETILI